MDTARVGSVCNRRCKAGLLLTIAACFGTPSPARADLAIWADFNATWATSLDQSATAAGVAVFSAAERAQIESIIVNTLEQVYAAYNVTFSTTDPGGQRTRINFGATGGAAGTFGTAPLDFRNQTVNQTANVYAYNFASFIEAGDARGAQINEIAVSLGGTAAHEAGHTLGLHHHHSYGTPGITPANYSNTGGLQNQHIMATGSTGLSETGRETPRSFSQWENVILEAALHLTDNPLATTNEAADAGDTTAAAQLIDLTSLAISQTLGALVRGNLGTPADVDVYSFTVASQGQVTAEISSDSRFANDFNSMLRLFGASGSSLLAQNDDVFYSGNVFNSGTFRAFDSHLLNIWLPTAGTYYLEVSSVGEIGAGDAAGDYYMIFAYDAVPEPSSVALLSLASLFGLAHLWRRRRASAQV